ncbi:MAG: phage virion morphogenesis protein [Peptostreptococcaceae bacterium]|nr:phage virion morphogenesis protein [Peptostreptococcaceae bacterium]
MSVQIEGNIEELLSALQRLSALDRKRLNRVIAEALRESTIERFQNEEDPEGTSWQPSLRAQGQNGSAGKTLAKSGRLKSSLSAHATDSGFAVGTNLIYAKIHQFGGVIAAKTRKGMLFKIGDRFVRVHSVRMPKRSYLGVSQEDRREVAMEIDEFMQEIVS